MRSPCASAQGIKMSIKVNICPISIAEQRLTHKEAEVEKQLNDTVEFIAGVKEATSLLSSSYERQYKHLQGQFAQLHAALSKREQELCHQLDNELHAALSSNENLISTAECLIDKAKIVLQDASDTHHKEKDIEFVKKCSSVSQALEDSFMSLLLLFSDRNACSASTVMETEVQVDEVLQQIGGLQFTDRCDTEEPQRSSSPDAVSTAASALDYTVHDDVNQANCSSGEELQREQELPDCDDVITHSSLISSPQVTDQALSDTAAEKPTLECIRLADGLELDVIVTGVKDPTDLCIQPYGDELVDLMERMGKFYGDLSCAGGNDGVASTLQVGGFCCAQYTQDDCWYRAMVTALDEVIQGNCATEATVKVKYVDYGNEEELPLSRLQPLDPSFLSLPCQALSCCVSGIMPSQFLLSDVHGNVTAQEGWPSQLNQWLEKLLLGKMVRVVVVRKESVERCGVDILIPCEWLLNDESLATFPVPIQCTINMKLILKPGSVIQLSALLCISGLAVPQHSGLSLPTCLPSTNYLHGIPNISHVPQGQSIVCSPASTAVLVASDSQGTSIQYVPEESTSVHITEKETGTSITKEPTDVNVPTSVSVTQEPSDTKITEEPADMNIAEEPPNTSVPTSVHVTEESGVEKLTDVIVTEVNGKTESDDQRLPTTSCLQFLSIELGPASDFSFLVSHVVSPREFYVHPVQEDIAQRLSRLTESLLKRYSIISNQCQLSLSALSHGLHEQDSSRRVLCCVRCPDDEQWYRGVISSPVQEGGKCLVQLLDFGEYLEVSLDNVYELAEEFRDLPAQAVRCSLESSLGNGSVNSSDGCALGDDNRVCRFLCDSAASRQLVACVKVEEAAGGCKLPVEYGSVLSVDVVDTSGEKDVHISQLLQDRSPDVLDSAELSQKKLSEWNPMERDYLAQRNNYGIDNEAAGLALHGYESTSRPCRFYKSEAGCFQGELCPYLHLQEGVYDKQMEEVHTVTEQLELPEMPLGSKSALHKSMKKQEAESAVISRIFFKLLEEMREHYDQHVFSERNVVSTEVGEIVAVRYDNDDWWYRARVVGTSTAGKIKVFYVDYGHYGLVCEEDVRSIKPDFLFVPFQAVECSLPGLCFPESASDSDKAEAKQYFESLVSGHVLAANVVTRSASLVLGLELYSNVHINKKLIESGYLRRADVQPLRKPNLHYNERQLMTPG